MEHDGGTTRWRGRRAAALLGSVAMLSGLVGCGGDESGVSPTTGPSAGCGRPDAALVDGGPVHVVEVDGVAYEYRLSVPPGPPDDARPLVLNLHGGFMTSEMQDTESGWPELGRTEGFVTVTPQAPMTRWLVAPDEPHVDVIRALLDEVERGLCIDTGRVYVTGFSLGAMLTTTLACVAPELFAAAAPVAGVVPEDGCTDGPPVPVLAVHGTADEQVLFDGSLQPSVVRAVGEAFVADRDRVTLTGEWAHRNGCAESQEETRPSPDVRLVTFGCPEGAETEIYVLEGGRHAWPRAGDRVDAIGSGVDFDATAAIWQFFAAHPGDER